MLGAVLGQFHLLTEAHDSFLKRYEAMETRLRSGLQRKCGERLAAVLFVCHIQLKLYNWFESQMEHGSCACIPAP